MSEPIDPSALAKQNFSWKGHFAFGKTVTYTFLNGTKFPAYYYAQNNAGFKYFNPDTEKQEFYINPKSEMEAFTQEQKALAKYLLYSDDPEQYSSTSSNFPTIEFRVSFSDVADFKFKFEDTPLEDTSPNGQITLANAKLLPSQWAAVTSAPSGSYDTFAGDAFFDNDDINSNSFNKLFNQSPGSLAIGGYGYLLMLHELEHAMGIQNHAEAVYGQNSIYTSLKYTIMADAPRDDPHPDMNASVFPMGLQLFDISAIQQLYGRNYSTRNDDTTYGLDQGFRDANTPFIYTIWDGGGLHDKISGAGYSSGVQIDLRQGHFSSIGARESVPVGPVRPVAFDPSGHSIDRGNVAIAYHTVIEDAVGSSHNDILIGNAWNQGYH